MRSVGKVFVGCVLLLTSLAVQAQTSALVARADSTDNSSLVAELAASFDTVDDFSLLGGTPTIEQLAAYDLVLAYSNSVPADPTAAGDVLADYVDQGGCLVLATYSLSSPWTISGRIQTTGYSPLVDAQSNGDVSGNLNALVPSDPIFDGVDLGALAYFHNSNFAHPDLDTGATLIADDGAGNNMIARNATGNVVAINLFPPDFQANNSELFKIFGNAAANCAGTAQAVPVIAVPMNNSYALLLLILGIAGLGMAVIRHYD
jgi:hypothetical protein